MIIKQRSITEIEVNGKEVRFEFAMPFTWEEVMQAAQIIHSGASAQIEAFKKQQEETEKVQFSEVDLPVTDEIKRDCE